MFNFETQTTIEYQRITSRISQHYLILFLSLSLSGRPPKIPCTTFEKWLTSGILFVFVDGSTENFCRTAARPASDCISPRRAPGEEIRLVNNQLHYTLYGHRYQYDRGIPQRITTLFQSMSGGWGSVLCVSTLLQLLGIL